MAFCHMAYCLLISPLGAAVNKKPAPVKPGQVFFHGIMLLYSSKKTLYLAIGACNDSLHSTHHKTSHHYCLTSLKVCVSVLVLFLIFRKYIPLGAVASIEMALAPTMRKLIS